MTESNKPKKFQLILSLFVGIVLLSMIGFMVWLGFKLTIYIFQVFTTLDTNLAVAIIAGSTTIIASTLAIVLGKHFEAKKGREVAHREKKVALYDDFLEKLFEIFLGEGGLKQAEFVPYLRDTQRKIILWASPNVIKSYADWHKELRLHMGNPKAKSMIKMIDFFLALRKDLGHSNKGIKHEHLARFMLKNPELFMQMYKQNSDISFDEIAKAEKSLQ